MRICYQEMFYSRSRLISPFDHLPTARIIGDYWCSYRTDLVRTSALLLDGKSFANVFSSFVKTSQKHSAVKEIIELKTKDNVNRDFSSPVSFTFKNFNVRKFIRKSA